MKCIIIGGGPAGLSAGIQLLDSARQSGEKISCVIIEKNIYGRKACGGLITPKSKRLLYLLGINADPKTVCNEVEVHYEKGMFAYTTKSPFYIIAREKLMKALFERFRMLGGTVVYSQAKRYDPMRKCVFAGKHVFYYDKLIIACGNHTFPSSTLVADANHHEKKSFGVSAIVTEQNKCNVDSKIRIWFLKSLKGYAWSFPLGNGRSNIGFAGAFCSLENYSVVKNEFERKIGYPMKNIQGATFPLSFFPSKSGIEIRPNIFVIGEAGNFFDSLSGEGVYLALYTGILTSQYILGKIRPREFLYAQSKLYEICKGSCCTQKLLFSNHIVLPKLLWAAKYLKKLDSYLTDNLLLEYKYGYYSAYCSPFFCYSHFAIPFSKQKILDKIVGAVYE